MRMSEVRSQKTELRSQQSEVRSQKCVHVILSEAKNLSSCSRLQPNCRRIPAGDSQSSLSADGKRPMGVDFRASASFASRISGAIMWPTAQAVGSRSAE